MSMATATSRPATDSSPRTRHGRSPTGLLVLGAVVLLLVSLASLAFGARPIGWSTLIEAFTHFDRENGDHAVVASRIPRTQVGLLVGAALGVVVVGRECDGRCSAAAPQSR